MESTLETLITQSYIYIASKNRKFAFHWIMKLASLDILEFLDWKGEDVHIAIASSLYLQDQSESQCLR